MDVISYNKIEIDSEFIAMFEEKFKKKLKKNLLLTRYISKLSVQYNEYKGKYIFPTKYKGINDFKHQIISFDLI